MKASWLLQVVLISFVQCSDIKTDLALFCRNNGLKYLSLTTTSDSFSLKKFSAEAYFTLQAHGVRSRVLPNAKLMNSLEMHTDTFVILTNTDILTDSSAFQMYLELMGKHRIRKSILVFEQPLSANHVQGKLTCIFCQNWH